MRVNKIKKECLPIIDNLLNSFYLFTKENYSKLGLILADDREYFLKGFRDYCKYLNSGCTDSMTFEEYKRLGVKND